MINCGFLLSTHSQSLQGKKARVWKLMDAEMGTPAPHLPWLLLCSLPVFFLHSWWHQVLCWAVQLRGHSFSYMPRVVNLKIHMENFWASIMGAVDKADQKLGVRGEEGKSVVLKLHLRGCSGTLREGPCVKSFKEWNNSASLNINIMLLLSKKREGQSEHCKVKGIKRM